MCTAIVQCVFIVLCMDLQLGTAIVLCVFIGLCMDFQLGTVLCVKLVQSRCKYQGHSAFQLFLSSIVKRFLSSIVKNFSASIDHASLPKTSCVKI